MKKKRTARNMTATLMHTRAAMREWDQALSEAGQGQSRTSMCKQERQTGKLEETCRENKS